jgi:hypothetical protein
MPVALGDFQHSAAKVKRCKLPGLSAGASLVWLGTSDGTGSAAERPLER